HRYSHYFHAFGLRRYAFSNPDLTAPLLHKLTNPREDGNFRLRFQLFLRLYESFYHGYFYLHASRIKFSAALVLIRPVHLVGHGPELYIYYTFQICHQLLLLMEGLKMSPVAVTNQPPLNYV